MAKPDTAAHRPSPTALTALLALALSAPAVLAQSSPWYVGASQSITHESNVYRLGGNEPTNSDWISGTTLLAGLDQTFGRQRAFVNSSLQHNRYRRNSLLNNTGYGLNAGLDWSTIERLSGRISFGANRSLAQFNAGGNNLQLRAKNVQTSRQASASVRYGLVSRWSIEATARHRSLSYTHPLFAFQEYRQNEGSLGVIYRPSAALSFGAALRATRGSYPKARPGTTPGSYIADDFRRNDLDLTSDWVVSGASSLNARLSIGRLTNDAVRSRDFSGVTGSVGWNWRPTPRLAFYTSLTRDTGQDRSFLNQGSNSLLLADNSRLTTAIQSSATYELTAKIALTAAVAWDHRSLTAANSGALGSDNNRSVSLGGRWSPTQSTQLGCQVTYSSRSSDSLAISLPFDATSTSCYGQIMLR